MHHFTLRKMKAKQPQKLGSMIQDYILNTEKPTALLSKQRAPRGARKRVTPSLNGAHLDRLMQLACKAGDKEMLTLIGPRRSFAVTKKELIFSIKNGSAE